MKKFEYIFKNVVFNDVVIYKLTEKQIEEGALDIILSSGMKENGYILRYIRQIKND